MNEFNLDMIGYFLYMEQQEEEDIEIRSTKQNSTSWEDEPHQTTEDD